MTTQETLVADADVIWTPDTVTPQFAASDAAFHAAVNNLTVTTDGLVCVKANNPYAITEGDTGITHDFSDRTWVIRCTRGNGIGQLIKVGWDEEDPDEIDKTKSGGWGIGFGNPYWDSSWSSGTAQLSFLREAIAWEFTGDYYAVDEYTSVVVTFTSTETKIYVGDTLVHTCGLPSAGTGNPYVMFGGYLGGGLRHFTGIIHDASCYPRELTSTERTWLATGGSLVLTPSVELVRIVETNAALPMARAITINRITETNEANAIGAAHIVPLARIVETNDAGTLSPAHAVSLERIVETNESSALSIRRTVDLDRIVETNEAPAVAVARVVSLDRIVETNEAGSLEVKRTVDLVRIVETNAATGLEVTQDGVVFLQRIVETNEPRSLEVKRTVNLTRIVETNAARPPSIQIIVPLVRVVETNEARSITPTPLGLMIRQYYNLLAG